ncbi:DUF6263 family protein [Elizabethkingia sp. JS20170427COW]|uniref:DUF6263 family protein n=1 Tax=Elizabethkingia sp. JS20170427COW TaxID=2583851 RepID=UPI001110DC49|nr:DUF6263 family protein [Elizabethkingia sp. JS20170427COW]QCX53927.1 hypothetical protein FGE20_09375 [Elizabethkingia sp. JS20170427COW]
MKKLIAASFLTLTLVACNKENKANSDKENVNTEATTSQTSTEEKLPEVKAAISDSAGVYTLHYQLEKGKTYPFVLVQKDVQTVSMEGKSQSQTNETTDKVAFKVNDVQNGVYDLDVIFQSKKQSGTAMGKTISVDTNAAEPKDESLKIFWKVNKAMMGNQVSMKMDDTGKIISITGFDPIYKKVETALQSAIKDANERKAIMQGFKQGFNEEALKLQFKTNLSLFPQKGLKIGESFSESINLTEDGKLKNTTTFTLAKVDNGVAEITIKGGIPKKSDKQSQNGITATMSIEGVQTGTLKLDTKTGWMGASTMTMTSHQSQKLSDGTKSQTSTQKTVSTTKINP